MSNVNVNEWTPEQIYYFSELFLVLKKKSGDKPLALTPEQRDIAIQLGLIPIPTVQVEVTASDGKARRGLLLLCDDGVYRGSVYARH